MAERFFFLLEPARTSRANNFEKNGHVKLGEQSRLRYTTRNRAKQEWNSV